MAIRVGMVSLGCPKNQMDAELMLAKLEQAGMRITADAALAEVVIVNTCGFISDAKKESIDNILEFAALKGEGRVKKILVTGCMAQRYREQIMEELPECDGVLGLGANRDIVEAVRQAMAGDKVESFPPLSCWELDGERLQTTPSFFAYMRIGDGCSNRCTYCAIPNIRGPLRSRPVEQLAAEARSLAEAGVKELILVAQDVTAYGVDLYGESRLPELLEELCKVDSLHWIRLLYCYPQRITDRLLHVMREQEKIVKYLDIPLQHVSGKVLKAMHRTGDAGSLKQLIAHIRETVPGMVLRTTLMVGFPGETKEDFTQLCEFVKEVKFERLGCFAYSAEEDTPAADMPGQVSERVKVRRRDILMQEQTLAADSFARSRIGQTLEVLVESYDRYAECWFGRSAADAPDIDGKVFFTCPKGMGPVPGSFVQVRVTEVMDWDLMGELMV